MAKIVREGLLGPVPAGRVIKCSECGTIYETDGTEPNKEDIASDILGFNRCRVWLIYCPHCGEESFICP